jgi:hypothetical protein
VPVLRARFHFSGFEDAPLVVAALAVAVVARRDEPKLLPAGGGNAFSERGQLLMRGPAIARQARERRAQRIEDRGVEPG